MDKDKEQSEGSSQEGPWQKKEAEPDAASKEEAAAESDVLPPEGEAEPATAAETDETAELTESVPSEPVEDERIEAEGADPEHLAAAELLDDPNSEGPPEIKAPAPEAPQRSGGMGGWLTLMIIAVVIGGAGFFAWPYLLNRATDWLPATLVAAIQANSETLDRLDRVEADIGGLKAQAGETQAQMKALQADVAALPKGGGSGSDPRVDGLMQSLAALTDTVTELQGRNEALAQKVDTLTTAAAGATAGGMAEAAQALQSGVADRLREADVRAAAAEARASSAQARAEVAEQVARAAENKLLDLERRLAALESTPMRTPIDEQRAAVLALGQLRTAVDAGRPYAAALDTVETVFGANQNLEPLRAHAGAGIVTLSALKSRFPDTIEAAIHARSSDGGFWDRTVDRLAGLVTVRRIGDVAGNETDAVMARAEVRLNKNDLVGAVDEMKALSGPAAEAAQGWLSDAVARVEAEQALDALQDAAIAKTAAG